MAMEGRVVLLVGLCVVVAWVVCLLLMLVLLVDLFVCCSLVRPCALPPCRVRFIKESIEGRVLTGVLREGCPRRVAVQGLRGTCAGTPVSVPGGAPVSVRGGVRNRPGGAPVSVFCVTVTKSGPRRGPRDPRP